MQQPGLPGKALKGFFVLPGQALHTLVIKFIGQGTGGLHQNAAAAPANLGGQAQFLPYCPQRSAAHISRTEGRGRKAERFAGAQWEKPFSFAKVISRSIGTLPPLDKACRDC